LMALALRVPGGYPPRNRRPLPCDTRPRDDAHVARNPPATTSSGRSGVHCFPRETPRRDDTLFLGWFGPVVVAALYYVTLSAREAGVQNAWVVGRLIVCTSLLVHGVAAAPLTNLYTRRSSHTGRSSGRGRDDCSAHPGGSGHDPNCSARHLPRVAPPLRNGQHKQPAHADGLATSRLPWPTAYLTSLPVLRLEDSQSLCPRSRLPPRYDPDS